MKKLYAVINYSTTKKYDTDVTFVTFDLEEAKKEARWDRKFNGRFHRSNSRDPRKTVLCEFPYLFQQEEATEDAGMLYDAAEDWYTYGEYEAVNF